MLRWPLRVIFGMLAVDAALLFVGSGVALLAQVEDPIPMLDVILQGGALALLTILLVWVLPKGVTKILDTVERVQNQQQDRFDVRTREAMVQLGKEITAALKEQTLHITAEYRRAVVEIAREAEMTVRREEMRRELEEKRRNKGGGDDE